MSIQNPSSDPLKYMAGNSVAANLLMLLFIVGGIFFFTRTTQEVFPNFTLDTVRVSVAYSGASPDEVEQGILLPIENALKEVENLDEITSTAAEGAGTVQVDIASPDLVFQAFQDIQGAVDRITTFPDDAEEPVISINSRKRGVLYLAVHGNASPQALRSAADYIQETLEQDNRIGPVDLIGARDYEIQIDLRQDQLRRYGLKISDIAEIIRSTAIDLPGGALETDQGDILVRMKERRNTALEFANIPIITSASGATVRLSDIAIVRAGLDDTKSFVRYNGEPAIQIEVSRVGDQTPISVVSAVREKLPEIKASLPEQLTISIQNDRSKMFSQRADLLLKNGYWGLGLVIIFLALFLDMRLAFWVSMGIPISFLGSFLLLSLTGFTVNMISMFAFIISLGIVVDDAVVVGENIYSKREKGLPPFKAAYEGVREVALPVCFSILTNIAAFIPLFYLPGMMGKIFQVIPLVVISVFIVSLIESLFILPAHLTFKQSKQIKNKTVLMIINAQKGFNKRFNYFVETYYAGMLRQSIEYRYITLAISVAILALSFGYLQSGRMGITMFPRIDSDYAFASVTMPSGTAEETLNRVQMQLESSAQKVVEENGQDQLSVGVYSRRSDNVIEGRIYLTDPDVRPLSTSEVTKIWREQTGQIIGAEVQAFQSNRGGPGAGAALTIELSHSNIATLEAASVELGRLLSNYPEISDIDDGAAQGKLQYDFTVNALGKAYGLTPVEIARQVRNSFQGQEALKQQDGRNEITIRLRLEEQERSSASDIEKLIIITPSGKELLLRDVVDIQIGQAYKDITRRNYRRIMTVTADVDPPSRAEAISYSLQEEELPRLRQKYPGLSWVFEGQQADLEESKQELFKGLLFVLFVIYTLMAVLFRSYGQPFIVMIAIPFSAVGAIGGHILMDFPISLMSMMGLLALVGVVVNDSLVLIDRANRLHKIEDNRFNAIFMAGIQRFRPIILTTLTTFLGLTPMIFETSRQALFLVPMAVSLGFGIIFATFITLILIPALYMVGEDLKNVQKMIGSSKEGKSIIE